VSAPHLFCFGLGYSALTLADALRAQGWRVSGTCRDPDKQRALLSRGVDTVIYDGSAPLPDLPALLGERAHVLCSAPPDEAGDPVLAHHADDLRRLARAGRLPWVGFLSSTGVYGDHQGAWVDESSATRPTRASGRRRLAAERAWRALVDQGVPVHVFRLAGIYGPGRSVFDRVRGGRARRLDKPDVVFSRIHVADLATALQASLAQPRAGAVYNVSDAEPAAPEAVTAYACELLQVEPPPLEPFDTAQVSPGMRAFYADRRRVKGDLLREELGVALAYPDYRAGLTAILAAEGEGEPLSDES
jgi:nucleoside-diphosphate-sugar epimerase